MPVSITLSSTSFANNGLIPVVHKNSTSCGEANFNPQLSWTVGGDLLPIMVESYALLVRDTTASNFIHWFVQGISPSQVSITANGVWLGAPVINPTDWATGDAANGWNGPCAPSSSSNNYEIQVRAYILPEYRDFLGLNPEGKAPWFDSDIYNFTDNNANISPVPNTGDCGDTGCAPGAILIDGLCQTIDQATVVVNPQQYNVTTGSQIGAYGDFGMRMYDNIDGLDYPLQGGGGAGTPNAFLHENATPGLPWTEGALVVLNSTTNNAGIWGSGSNAGAGRLNLGSVWPMSGGAARPYNEWIGFSQCLDVPVTKEYCIGVAADNRMRFKINGELIVAFVNNGVQRHFKNWHIIPITLNAGVNIIEMTGLNETASGAFAAEIYDATPAQLIGAVSAAEIDSYLFWSTQDLLVTDVFTVGGETIPGWDITDTVGSNGLSGSTCPEGYTLSPTGCTTGDCVQITYAEPEVIDCCWLIENCKDENETYLMELSLAETEIMYNNVVYEFGGQAILLTKCFILKERVVCPEPDLTGVTVIVVHGTGNCNACNPSLKFESCDTPGEFEYISLAVEGYALVVGNIYQLDQLQGCYSYVGEIFTIPPVKTDMVITEDYNTDDCIVCSLCVSFKNCKTDVVINVYLAAGQTIPSPNEIVLLSGDPALLDTCWQFISDDFACDPGTIDYTDVVIDLEYGCIDCDTCNPKYLLTDCLDATNTIEIAWLQSDAPLDESLTYIFDIDLDICWTVSFLPPIPCIDGEELPVLIELGTSNIVTTYLDCDECNKPCYKLISCDDSWPTVATVSPAFAVYVNSTVEWIDNGALTPTKRCATVYQYTCRKEDYPMPGGGPFPTEPLATEGFTEITILDCFKTCAECEYIAPIPAEEEIKTGRKVRPGYTVPDCVTTTKCDDCE